MNVLEVHSSILLIDPTLILLQGNVDNLQNEKWLMNLKWNFLWMALARQTDNDYTWNVKALIRRLICFQWYEMEWWCSAWKCKCNDNAFAYGKSMANGINGLNLWNLLSEVVFRFDCHIPIKRSQQIHLLSLDFVLYYFIDCSDVIHKIQNVLVNCRQQN